MNSKSCICQCKSETEQLQKEAENSYIKEDIQLQLLGY